MRVQRLTSAAEGQGAWHGSAKLRFACPPARPGLTLHQGGATAPLKLQRAFTRADGRCELPLLHTAGGLVGGDSLRVSVDLAAGSRALITSVAAQKVYGSVGRSRLAPAGRWARQTLEVQLAAGSDLEWLPQELVIFDGGLFEQTCRVELAQDASWLGAEVVRLGRSAAAETLREGGWRSCLEIRSQGRWCVADRIELGGATLTGQHGMGGWPVFGSLIWVAPVTELPAPLGPLLERCRSDRQGLAGEMACGPLEHGLVARYRGPSTQAARWWFTRIWSRIRAHRRLAPPELPRVWPFQEDPLAGLAPPQAVERSS
jgi:urease accessory protein